LAEFRCINDGPPLKSIRIELTPFVFGTLSDQRISIALDGKVLGTFRIGNVRGKANPIVLKLPEAGDLRHYSFSFSLPDATSPVSLGMNSDSRRIAFSFQSISLE
jgi:hypothetical protein